MLLEIIIYTVLIYLLLYFYILITPTLQFIIFLFILAAAYIWIVLIGCDSDALKKIVNKLLISVVFGVISVILYYIIHNNWNKTLCKMLIIMFPVLFFVFIRQFEKHFICKKNYILYSPIRIIRNIIDMISKYK